MIHNLEFEKATANEDKSDPLIGTIFFSKYKTIRRIGEGAFGKVYEAEYNGEFYAVKLEDRKKELGLLETEALIYNFLKGKHIPSIKSFGYSGNYNVLVMQLLDQTLEDLLTKHLKFTIKTTSMLGYQMIKVLNFIHDRHIIHRDIKPENFAMGAYEQNKYLYILDFGLAKKYRSSRTLVQYPFVKKKKLTGTARYASIHALEAYEQSRRDDLESVGYVLMYFLRGNLPWQSLKAKTKEERYQKILEKKKEISSKELCRGYPKQFYEFLEYVKNLGYEERPDYDMLRKKFLIVCKDISAKFDYIYDWTTEYDLKNREKAKLKEQKEKEREEREKQTEENEKKLEDKLKKIDMISRSSDEDSEGINARNYMLKCAAVGMKREEETQRLSELEKMDSVCCKM